MVLNGAQFHMLANHLPVIGFLGMVIALGVAIKMSSLDVKRFVLMATALVGLSSLAALWTGEPAEEAVEHLPGVSEALIHEHEEAGEFANILALFTAFAALGALYWQKRDALSLKKSLVGVWILSIITLAAMAKAAHEGGKIRHPEIRGDAATGSFTNQPAAHEDEEYGEDE
jgi:hypothetical protein